MSSQSKCILYTNIQELSIYTKVVICEVITLTQCRQHRLGNNLDVELPAHILQNPQRSDLKWAWDRAAAGVGSSENGIFTPVKVEFHGREKILGPFFTAVKKNLTPDPSQSPYLSFLLIVFHWRHINRRQKDLTRRLQK